MANTFEKIATVEFAVYGTPTRITVNDLPFIYGANENPDQQAIFAAIGFLRDQGFRPGLDVVSVCTSPVQS